MQQGNQLHEREGNVSQDGVVVSPAVQEKELYEFLFGLIELVQ